MQATVTTKIKTRIVDALTGKVVSESPWQKNLVMDGGLNALARSTNATNPAEMFSACRIGSSNAANSTASGAVTFTQSGTTITASAGFFTSGMVGQLFKYGTGSGGAEYYITAFTDSTHVTVDTSATVSTPTVATIWAVNQTALTALLYTSTTYETTAGSCGSTISANSVTHKRTFNFAQQASPYNVNEIGYFRVSTGTTVFGRLVLGSTDVVAPTNFYQVILSITVTYTPSAPTAVADVGTNINTAGNAMFEQFATCIATVGSSGAVSNAGANASIDGSVTGAVFGSIATYSQNGTTTENVLNWGATGTGYLSFQSGLTWTFASVRGKMTLSSNGTISTSGQTLYGVGVGAIGSPAKPAFDVKLTTTFTLPTGSFLPQCVFSVIYGRALTN